MPDETPHLREHDPSEVYFADNGDEVSNFTDDEYAATYADGEPCNQVPDDVMAVAVEQAERHADPTDPFTFDEDQTP